MDYSDPNAFTLPFQLTKQIHRDVYPLLEPTQPELSAKGKTVLITGVTGGIAKGIADSWATAGASGIVVTGRKADALESFAERLQRTAPEGTKVLAKAADITDEASVKALFAAAKEAFGKVDVLINSAGALDASLVASAEAEKMFNDFKVNVLGTFLMTQQFLAQADGAGTVVSFTTGAIGTIFPGMGGYTASKQAMVRLMENLHAEQPEGIRIFCLIPGIVPSEMTLDALKPYAKDTPAISGSWTLFLSTPRADWMRGGIVSVNWDIEEMEAHKDEIIRDSLLSRAFLNAKLGKDGHPWSS